MTRQRELGSFGVKDIKQAGETIAGRYRVISVLGLDGVCCSYACHDMENDNLLVTVKLLPKQLAKDDALRLAVRKSVMGFAAISHPNVMLVYHFFEEGSEVGFSFENLEGVYLSAKSAHIFSPKQLAKLLIQVAHGIEALHQTGLVHCDLKPQTLFLGNGDIVKVVPTMFACASGSYQADFPPTNPIPLPLAFLCAETRFSWDIYRLGVIGYEAALGRSVITGKSVMDLDKTAEPTPLSDMIPHFPRSFSDVIAKALHRNPAECLQSAKEMREALEKVQKTL